MKRRLFIGGIVAICLLVGAAFVVSGQSAVPPAAIEQSVIRRPELIEQAWQLPVAKTFESELAFQSNGSLCGPASAANVFRSLGEPTQTESEVLEGTGLCWTGYCIAGLTLDELADLIRSKTHRKVTVLRDLTAEQFHEHMKRSNDPARRYIINFTREKIFGAGAGHHSPVGGYLEDRDLVFVLDVNQKFGPWLVQRNRLYAAMDTLDGDHKRGLILIE